MYPGSFADFIAFHTQRFENVNKLPFPRLRSSLRAPARYIARLSPHVTCAVACIHSPNLFLGALYRIGDDATHPTLCPHCPRQRPSFLRFHASAPGPRSFFFVSQSLAIHVMFFQQHNRIHACCKAMCTQMMQMYSPLPTNTVRRQAAWRLLHLSHCRELTVQSTSQHSFLRLANRILTFLTSSHWSIRSAKTTVSPSASAYKCCTVQTFPILHH